MSIRLNSVFGFLGFAIPAIVMLFAYPILMRSLGLSGFGIYILATSTSGALAFLDFGFSSATVKFIAEDLARGRTQDAGEVLGTSLLFYGALGAVCASALWILSPWLTLMFHVGISLRPQALWAFRLAAIQFAVFLLTAVFLALFKGMQRFHWSTASLSLLSLLTYGGAVLAVRHGLVGVTATSLGANILVLLFSATTGLRILRPRKPRWSVFRRMFAFGSMMTVNSVSGLLLYQVQRYLIAIGMGPAAVAIYQTASVAPAKVHAAVTAFTEVLFPVASASPERVGLRGVYLKMMEASALIIVLTFAPLLALKEKLFSMWLGPHVAAEALPILTPFILAYIFLAMSPAPFHLLNGLGKPGINTAFFAMNAMVNVLCVGIFNMRGASLLHFAWAFALANIVTGCAYQLFVEFSVWRGAPDPVRLPPSLPPCHPHASAS